MVEPGTTEEVEALRAGRAFADLSGWRKVQVGGSDARTWLNDLLTADIARLEPGRSSRTLLLSPTGRIRADVTVALTGEGFLLVQDPNQPAAIDSLLMPYVLSSDVRLGDRTESTVLLAFPGPVPGDLSGFDTYRPSALGVGTDLVAPDPARSEVRAGASHLLEAGPAALDAWRVERGAARFGVDLGEDSLPHEAGLDAVIGYEKGCFLGQEAAAKVRNLGHPPFVVLAARADQRVPSGAAVLAEGAEVGTVTSVAATDGETAVIARVRWGARDADLSTGSGARLTGLRPASGTA